MRCLFVLDLVIFFFPLAAKLIGPQTGRQFFKNVDFLDLHPLKVCKFWLVLKKDLRLLFSRGIRGGECVVAVR